MMDLYGVGDHGGGPTRAMLDEGFHWAATERGIWPRMGGVPLTPKYQFSTAQSFFSTVEKQIAPESPVWNYQSIAKGYEAPAAVAGKVAIPTWDTELYLEYHRGVYTTQANHKKNMRDSEEEVLNAEKFSSLAWVLAGRAYPSDEITEDWKKVLFNQFHDLAAGSGIGVIYKDAQKDYDWVRMSTNEISAGALETVAQRIDTAGRGKDSEGQSIIVFNPLGWERSGEVNVNVRLPAPASKYVVVDSLSATKTVPSDSGGTVTFGMVTVISHLVSQDVNTGVAELQLHVIDVPALGYKVFHVVPETSLPVPMPPSPPRAGPQVGDLILRSRTLSVTVNKTTGCITSIYDDRSGFEALAKGACGNQLQVFKDTPKDYDAWNVDPGTLDQPPTLLTKADSVELLGGHTSDSVRSRDAHTGKIRSLCRPSALGPSDGTIRSTLTTTSTGTKSMCC